MWTTPLCDSCCHRTIHSLVDWEYAMRPVYPEPHKPVLNSTIRWLRRGSLPPVKGWGFAAGRRYRERTWLQGLVALT